MSPPPSRTPSPSPFYPSDPHAQSTHHNLFTTSLTIPLPTDPVLPPGLTPTTFATALDLYKSAVGPANVLTGAQLTEYTDPYELYESDPERRKLPCAAVCPEDVEELRRVLEISNEYGVPVWTFSRGKNLGYGGPAPLLPGSLALSLHRMTRILTLSPTHAYAVVEPGVTFSSLYSHLTSLSLPLWPSVPSLSWGSVVGNTLDRGTGFTPTATHHQHICGLEIMLATGELVRTGQFAVDGSPSAHLSKFSFGPSVEGLFLQSNLGIVTKMGIWLTPAPRAYMACTFDVPDLEDVEALVEALGPLRRDGTLPNTVYVSNVVEGLGMVGRREELWEGEGVIPGWRVRELQEEMGVGYWNARFGLYGEREVVQAHFDAVQRIVREKVPKGRLKGTMFAAEEGKVLDAASIPEEHGGFFVGVPSLWSLPMVKFRLPKEGGIGAHYDYSPIIPSSGKAVLEWVQTAKRVCEAEGFDLFCDFFMHERHVIFVNMMTFDKTNHEHRRAVQAIFTNLFEEGKKRGYSKYRSHINAMDMVASLYDFNNHAYRRFVETIKDAVDPKGILSPGKQGIWPKRFRGDENPKAHL